MGVATQTRPSDMKPCGVSAVLDLRFSFLLVVAVLFPFFHGVFLMDH